MLESIGRKLEGKVLILGMGNTLRGDDGAGPYLIKQLKGRVDATLLNGEDEPENLLGQITGIKPDYILIVDSVDLSANPGSVALLEGDQLERRNLFTHKASLKLFIECLKGETGANVLVLGIQPKSIEIGRAISSEVKESLGHLRDILIRAFAPRGFPPEKNSPAPFP
jgi:hydrogenase 3 maturation protease